ncbi:MAG: hypothetical protein ACUVT7_06975, partial [Thermoplasmata archaeon]
SDRSNYTWMVCGRGRGPGERRATDLGFVAHPIAGYDPLKVKAALGIPDEYTVITLVNCGYPGGDESILSDKQKGWEKTRPERKPISENIFLDKWANPYPLRGPGP